MFRIFTAAANRESVITRLSEAGALAISPELELALRLEAGRPAWGVDLTTDTIPLEAGLLDRAISTTKGCYVGQEIVIRILHRAGGRVARRLARIAIDGDVSAAPAAGTPLTVAGTQVGHLTSVSYSPGQRRVIALGYVHRDAAEVSRTVDAGGVAGAITGFAT
jgi:folate-binding protein YgfZ